MIEPIFRLLQQVALGQRTGMLLLVTTTSGPASRLIALWLHEGQMVHVSGCGREGAAALLLLHHARRLQRWQWFDLDRPTGLREHQLPDLQAYLDHEQAHVVPVGPVGADQAHMDRLITIQQFLHTMNGDAGEDAFMQILFDHPPSRLWDELVEAYRDHISLYFGAPVARQVVDA